MDQHSFTRYRSKLLPLALALGMASAAPIESLAMDAGSFDNGERVVIALHWKIEHRSSNPVEILIKQAGTPEGRALLATLATLIGADPQTASVVATAIPLPSINYKATDNRGLIPSPAGMTVCNAGPIGHLEASRAAWSASLVRNGTQNGISYYTSVGTGAGATHRIEGSFFVEFVKPVENWEAKYKCHPPGVQWDIKNVSAWPP